MFQFFMTFVGLVVAGYAALSKDGPGLLPTALALFAALLTVFFMFLDRRNEELVHVAEDVLESLEWDVLFSKYDRPVRPKRRRWWGGMTSNDREEKQLGIFRRQTADDYGEGREPEDASGIRNIVQKYRPFERSKYEHGKWLPRFQFWVLVMFFALAIGPWIPKLFTSFCSLLGAGK